jgi:hypothetical protein
MTQENDVILGLARVGIGVEAEYFVFDEHHQESRFIGPKKGCFRLAKTKVRVRASVGGTPRVVRSQMSNNARQRWTFLTESCIYGIMESEIDNFLEAFNLRLRNTLILVTV